MDKQYQDVVPEKPWKHVDRNGPLWNGTPLGEGVWPLLTPAGRMHILLS